MRYQEPTVHYIQAQPGWTVATPIHCDYDDETCGVYGLHIEPVICWQMVTEVSEQRDRHPDGQHTILTWTNPVTAHRVYECDDGIIIGKPDGTFSEPESQDFDSADAVLSECRKCEKRKREKTGAST